MPRELARDDLSPHNAAVIAAQRRTASRLTPRPSYKSFSTFNWPICRYRRLSWTPKMRQVALGQQNGPCKIRLAICTEECTGIPTIHERLRPDGTGDAGALILKAIENKRSKGSAAYAAGEDAGRVFGSTCGDMVPEQSRAAATRPA